MSEDIKREKDPLVEARHNLAERIDEAIIEPLAVMGDLLTGYGAGLEDEDKRDIDPQALGCLFGLIVRGARCELKIQEEGGYGAQMLRSFLGLRITMEG